MRYLNLQSTALISLLVGGIAAGVACSSGSDSNTPTPTATSTSGAGGATSGTTSTTATGTAGSATATTGTAATTGTTATTATGAGGAGTGGTGSGTGGAGGSTGPSVCDGAGTRILTAADTFVDDFEEAAVSPGWSTFSDTMPQNGFMMMQVAGGAAGTAHAGRYMGTGAKTTAMMGFGVGAIFNVAIDTTAGIYCIDISAFDGVSFWAKAGTDMAKVNVNFVLPSTNMVAANPMLGGGDCKTGCYNHPAKTVVLSTDWKQYSVAFADAASTTGTRVKNVIQELGWLSPDSNWDFTLDEIQFYKGTAPTGPAGVKKDGGP